jgi:hypothetical protein
MHLVGMLPAKLLEHFPRAEFIGTLAIPRHTLRKGRPVAIGYAFVRPQP